MKSFTGLLVAAVLLSFAVVAVLPLAPGQFGDQYFHLEAKALAAAVHGAGSWSDVRITRAAGPVLYYAIPYLVLPAGASENAFWIAGCLWNAACTLIATVLIYRAARLLAGETAGRIAAILAVASPLAVYYAFGIASETPAYLGATIFAYGWAKQKASVTSGFWVACFGLVFLILCRPNVLPVLAVALLIGLAGWTRKSPSLRRESKVAFGYAVTALVALAATYFVLAQQRGNSGLRTQSTNFSEVMLMGSFQHRTELWDWRFWGKQTRQGSVDYETWSQVRGGLFRRSTETLEAFGKLERDWVVQDVREHPLLHLRMTAMRVLSMNVAIVNSASPASFGFGPIRGLWVFVVSHVLLNVISLLPLLGSLWFLIKSRGEILAYWPLWAPWFALLTFHAVVYSEPRYLLPSRPLLCIMAALMVTRYLDSRGDSVKGLAKEDHLVTAGRRQQC